MVSMHSHKQDSAILEEAEDARMARLVGELADRGPATRERAREALVALGKPAERVVLEDGIAPEGRPYWRDSQGVHHVPKRPLAALLVSER